MIKRDRASSATELIRAITHFVGLLAGCDEEDAVEFLHNASSELETHKVGSKEFNAAVEAVLYAFEGEDFELIAYTLKKSVPSSWSDADELAVASNRVLSLARRLK